MSQPINVTIWNEHRHELSDAAVSALYPHGIHGAIAGFLAKHRELKVRTATLDEPDHGLGGNVLDQTDVLIWWGHVAHHEVRDEVVNQARQRVLEGMGLIVLHSSHFSKVFKSLMGTPCALKWRDAGDKEILWNLMPGHPIAAGVGDYLMLPSEEMYGEPFSVPTPEEVIFISWFSGGEVFRSGCTWRRGHGRIFYFRPGHENHPTYHDPGVQRIIANAVRWARPTVRLVDRADNTPPIV